MANNPLQKFFRQPKVFLGLPSHGIYNQPGSIQGDVENLPVFGMTGMDEILIKTPDALLNGESTVQVIESCISGIKDAWDICNLDIDSILTAIRIATYGNTMNVAKTCPQCSAKNEYTLDLSHVIEYFKTCKYDNTLALKEFNIVFRPLVYRQTTDFSLRNFELQKKLQQVSVIEDQAERSTTVSELFRDLAILQNDIYAANIESVNSDQLVVNEKMYIREWIDNCDKEVIDSIKDHLHHANEMWTSPKYDIKCDECSYESSITVDLDLSNFFGND